MIKETRGGRNQEAYLYAFAGRLVKYLTSDSQTRQTPEFLIRRMIRCLVIPRQIIIIAIVITMIMRALPFLQQACHWLGICQLAHDSKRPR